MSDDNPLAFLIFVAVLALGAYGVYRIGKRSTACGITFGIGLIVLAVIVLILTAQIGWHITLTPSN